MRMRSLTSRLTSRLTSDLTSKLTRASSQTSSRASSKVHKQAHQQRCSTHRTDHDLDQRFHETVSQGKTSSGQGCQTNPSTLKPTSLPSDKQFFGKIAVCQGLEVPSPDIFDLDRLHQIVAVKKKRTAVCTRAASYRSQSTTYAQESCHNYLNRKTSPGIYITHTTKKKKKGKPYHTHPNPQET